MIPPVLPKKSVRFDLHQNTERTFTVPDDTDRSDLWFTPEEFDQTKRTSRSESREWRKVYSHLLNETFENPRPDAQDYLTAFCLMQGDLYRRGLERQCNRHHGEQRSDCKDRTRYLVFETQRRLKLSGAKKKNNDEALADIYMESCRHAKVFANRIAKADEIVALGKMDCAARTQGLVVPQAKRRSSGMSIQSSTDSMDSRMLFLHQHSRGGASSHHQRHHHHRSLKPAGGRKYSNTTSSSMLPIVSTRLDNEAYAAIA